MTTMSLEQALPRLADALRWIIVIAIVWTISSTILNLLGDEPAETSAAEVEEPTASSRPALSVREIAARNLFGDASKQAAPTVVQETITETSLPLELNGVFEADGGSDGAAIISERGKPGKLYQVGETVRRGVELVEVNVDHVVLSRAGVREVLRFAKSAAAFAAVERAPVQSGSNRSVGRSSAFDDDDELADDDEFETFAQMLDAQDSGLDAQLPATPREFLELNAERLEEDPSSLLADYGVEPVAEGSASGYRISGALAQSPYLSQAGLQAGDVVLSVNGEPVGNVQSDRASVARLMAAGSATIEIQRGSRRFVVTASLGD